ncbi:hypothetical protein E2562_036565 [Oryza meyeriana var. granulata]|uniref:Uncharacterized protein n=1 Tax=Oryza meyeriana var. granulata TaxID=110450 RepID=A0A6G1ECI1_9ORYZ|nr:hypothetical protein E2562_036565 [Oryza meyeriana var. granulata]
MAVPVAEQPVQAAAIHGVGMSQRMVEEIQDIGGMVAAVTTHLELIRSGLDVAAGLLGEDIDAAEILDADVLAVLVPEGQAPLPYATVDAAAKLFASVSSGAPLLPGAIRDAGDLISAVFEFDHQAPAPTGVLQIAITDLEIAFGFGAPPINVEDHFRDSAPYLHVQEGDPTWLTWTQQTERAKQSANEALTRLNVVAWEAMDSVEILRSHCLVQSPERNEHMRGLEMNLLVAIKYVNKALVALNTVRDAVVLMDQILHQVIGNIYIPMAMNP